MMETRDVSDPVQTFLGIKASALVWGLLGGATAAALGPGSWQHRAITAIVGGIFAVAFGPLVVRFLDTIEADRWQLLADNFEPGVTYLCGLSGMMLCGTVLEFLKRVKTKAPDIADRVIDKD